MFEWRDVMASQQRRSETLLGRCKRSSYRIHGLELRQQRCAMRPIGAVNNLPASVLKGPGGYPQESSGVARSGPAGWFLPLVSTSRELR